MKWVKILGFKEISNWNELFDMTLDYLTFLIEEDKIKNEMVIKCTYDILNNAGYGYSLVDVRMKYYEGKRQSVTSHSHPHFTHTF